MIGDDMRLARHLHALVQRHPGLRSDRPRISASRRSDTCRATFGNADRTPEVEAYLKRLNQELLARVEQSGEAFLSNAVVGGRFVLRACIVNFRTSLADIEALPPMLSRFGQEADGEMRDLRWGQNQV